LKKTFTAEIGWILGILLLSDLLFAQGIGVTTGTLAGDVSDDSHIPIANVLITITGPEGAKTTMKLQTSSPQMINSTMRRDIFRRLKTNRLVPSVFSCATHFSLPIITLFHWQMVIRGRFVAVEVTGISFTPKIM
jgi:hypothetical protein